MDGREREVPPTAQGSGRPLGDSVVPGMRRHPGLDRDGEPGSAPILGVTTAVVTDLVDSQQAGRIGIALPQASGPDRRLMARLATLHAGSDRGTWFLPDVGDQVLVAFEDGDVDRPIVLGSLWNDDASPPTPGDHDNTNDVKLFRSRAGTVLEFDDSSPPRVELRTAGGTHVLLTEGSDHVVVEDTTGNRITMRATGITIESSSRVTVHGSTVEIEASTVKVDSAMATFTGTVKAETLIANSVVASNYTPGAGNIW